MKRLRPETWLLLAILLAMLPLRVLQTWMTDDFGIDGGFYLEVARNVRDGRGFVSQLSLYHAGDDQFPHPTSLYPLWPVLLGLVGRVVRLTTAAHWLPLGLAFLALHAAYRFGRKLDPTPLLPELIPAFHAGHLLVILLGLQRNFLAYTSRPFTEPLAFLLLFWGMSRALDSPRTLARAAELGLWCGLVYLCRSQWMIVSIAAILAGFLPVLMGPDRLRAFARLVVMGAVIGAMLGGWWLWLSTFVHEPGLSTLLRFDQNRASDLLGPFEVLVDAGGGVGGLVLDRLTGLVHGWDMLSDGSYIASFYASPFALPLALPLVLAAAWRGRAGAADALRSARAEGWAFVLLVAAGGLASIQLAHKQFNSAWYFDDRQSLICVVAFFLAIWWLLRTPQRLFRLFGRAVLATSTLVGVHAMADYAILQPAKALKYEDSDAEVARWLKARSADGPIRVVMSSGKIQRVGWRTKDVGYHWFYEETSYADVLTMTDRLGADYVIYGEEGTSSWRFRRQGAGAIPRDFERVDDAPASVTILRRRRTPPVAAAPERIKVLLVGVDGASWKVMGPMIEAGELPTFARLRREGASQVDFDTLDVTHSPVVWTTVATGRRPATHGVEDYTTTLPDGSKVPITSDTRKVPALWNLVSEAGRQVLAINWWASWPAEEVRGWVVSDHANPAAAGWMKGRYWKADAEALSALHKDTYPPELADRLASLWVDPEAFPLDEVTERGQLSPEHRALLDAAPFNERETWSWFKTFYALDRPHVQIALDQLQAGPADLTMLYLRGPDPVQHYAWNTVEPWRYDSLPPTYARDRGVVPSIYRYVDSFLGDLLAAVDDKTVVIVLSDHGAEPAPGATRKGFKGRPGGHTREAKGVLFLWGPHVRPGQDITGAGPLDIAPTVAWLLGLPIALNLDGSVLIDAFDADLQLRQGRTNVKSWGTRTASEVGTTSPADANMLEQLRGLGYIE